jgi:hypothetical protein
MKIDDRWKEINNRSYAQAAAGRVTGTPQAIRVEAQSMAPTEEKRIIIHLPDTTTAETVGEQSREEIIERIRGDAGAAPANRQVVAVRKLKSGDLAVYVNNLVAKKEMESAVD